MVLIVALIILIAICTVLFGMFFICTWLLDGPLNRFFDCKENKKDKKEVSIC